MKIFITGSESFIGGYLWKRLAAAGHELSGIDAAQTTRAGAVKMDLRDANLAEQIPKGATVIHLAAVSTDSLCKADPLSGFDVNITGTLNLARAAALRGASQLVFASTEWVYGDVSNDAVQTEEQPIDLGAIQGSYAAGKLVGETVLRLSGLADVTVLRFGIVYGPRVNNWSAVESLLDKVLRGEPVTVGSARTSRRFIFVTDLCAGIEAALGRTGFEIFNLTGDQNVSLGDVICTAAQAFGKNPAFAETAPDRPSVRNPPNSKAREALHWQPRVALEEGLREVASFWGKR